VKLDFGRRTCYKPSEDDPAGRPGKTTTFQEATKDLVKRVSCQTRNSVWRPVVINFKRQLEAPLIQAEQSQSALPQGGV